MVTRCLSSSFIYPISISVLVTLDSMRPLSRKASLLLFTKCSLAPPDLCVFTGDVTNSGAGTEFDQALSWFQELLRPWPACPLAVVPGNHDVERRKANLCNSPNQQGQMCGSTRSGGLALRVTLNALRTSSGRSPRRIVTQASTCSYAGIRDCSSGAGSFIADGATVRVLGVNTAFLSCDSDDTTNDPSLPGALVLDTSGIFNRRLTECHTDAELILVAGHHPIEGCLTPWNAPDVRQALGRAAGGAHAWLHGHMHVARSIFHADASGASCATLGAGACYQGTTFPEHLHLQLSTWLSRPLPQDLPLQSIGQQLGNRIRPSAHQSPARLPRLSAPPLESATIVLPRRLDDGEASRLDDGHRSGDSRPRSVRNAHRRVGSPGFSSVMAG